MTAAPFRVVLTGSESTGKTTLAHELADHFDAMWCGEYSRVYAEGHPELCADDVEPIARGQMALEDERAGAEPRLVVHDTDLLSTMVYARHYYGSCPQWIVDAVRARRADLYLLMEIDVPWVPDGVRDRGDRRREIHELFREALEEVGARYVEIAGSWDERRGRAIEVISETLAEFTA